MKLSASLLLAIAFFFALPGAADAARLWSSGCELQAGSAGNMTDDLEFGAEGTDAGSQQVSTSIFRSGLASCRMIRSTDGQANGKVQWSTTNVATDLYFRMYLYIATMPTESAAILYFWDQGIDGTEGGVRLNSGGTLSFVDDEGDVIATGATVLSTATWYRIEFGYDAATDYEIRINGSTEVSGGAHDGDNVESFIIGLCVGTSANNCGADAAGQGDLYFDDMALNDTSGSAQTSWPGAGSIVNMQPDAAGDNTGCSAGTYADVDEVTPDDVTTYCNLDLDTGGDIFDVNMESSSTAGIDSYDTITLVHTGYREAKASAASAALTPRVKSASGGTTSSGTSVAGSNTVYSTNGVVFTFFPRGYQLVSYTDPTTAAAWTPTGTNSLDNMQVGINCTDCNPDARVSTLFAVVEYNDGSPPAPSAATFDSIIWFRDESSDF